MAIGGAGLLYLVTAMLHAPGSPSAFTGAASVVAGVLFVALPLSFAYGIIAQRLFDVRILVRHGLQYALAKRSLVLLVPALAAALVVDLMVHADRPLIEIVRQRGWAYAALVGFAMLAYRNRERWMESLDRRFFRERYDGQRILTQVIAHVHAGRRLELVAAHAVSQMREAFHCSFVALLLCEPHQSDFEALAVAPHSKSVASLARDSTLAALVRVMGRPIELANAPTWLADQLSAGDATIIRNLDVDLVAPIVTGTPDGREALLVFGRKRSDEPYSRDDRDLVRAVAESLAWRLQPPRGVDADDAFAECPQCGLCGAIQEAVCAEDRTPLIPVAMPRVLSGRYTFQRRLGRGGMGTVYESYDCALERQVAVKVVRDDRLGSPAAADAFRREALVAASFTHPNVVTVFDYGLAGNARGYLVMELLLGDRCCCTAPGSRRDERSTYCAACARRLIRRSAVIWFTAT
jgi:hypothetical protein